MSHDHIVHSHVLGRQHVQADLTSSNEGGVLNQDIAGELRGNRPGKTAMDRNIPHNLSQVVYTLKSDR